MQHADVADVCKEDAVRAVGLERDPSRQHEHLHDAERHLFDALGARQTTRRFVEGLFGRVPAGAPN